MREALLVALLLGCQPVKAKSDAGDVPSVCTKLGATCTVSPGKLGSCVEVEQTSGPSMFVCQSQH